MPMDFLPQQLDESLELNLIIAQALEIFRNDFYNNTPPSINGIAVHANQSITASAREQSFDHVITRGPKDGQPRSIDISRASRVPWIRPLIENFNNPELVYFQYLEGSGYVRDYIWDRTNDYVVILENKGHQLHLVTAFNIDVDWKRYDLLKKQKKALKP